MTDVACPGCGVELPVSGSFAARAGVRASPECLDLVGEVVAFGHRHPDVLGVWHQTTTDAYALQHVTDDTRPMTVWFALNTLYLVLERGWTGVQGRAAHGYLADTRPRSDWTPLARPASVGTLTVLEPALATTPGDQVGAVQRWGRAVWEAWSAVHDLVRTTTDRQLDGWRPPG